MKPIRIDRFTEKCPKCGELVTYAVGKRTMHDLVVALAKRLEEQGVTYEELERIFHDAEEEARKEIARMKGADNDDGSDDY